MDHITFKWTLSTHTIWRFERVSRIKWDYGFRFVFFVNFNLLHASFEKILEFFIEEVGFMEILLVVWLSISILSLIFQYQTNYIDRCWGNEAWWSRSKTWGGKFIVFLPSLSLLTWKCINLLHWKTTQNYVLSSSTLIPRNSRMKSVYKNNWSHN